MARLKNNITGKTLYLMPHHIIGRHSNSVDTIIEGPEISNLHAIIKWHENTWTIKDISRNGTWLNGGRLKKFSNQQLQTGMQISFASPSKNLWSIEDISAPQALLYQRDNPTKTINLTNYNILPNTQNPEYVLFLLAELETSSTHSWQFQRINEAENTTPISHNATIVIEHQPWNTFFPNTCAATREWDLTPRDINDYHAVFDVSLDEEHVAVSIESNYNQISLGANSHYYLLLHLARCRVHDKKQGLAEKDQGWINNDVLAKALGIDEIHLNIQVFRIRKKVSIKLSHISNHSTIIERRRGATRIGIDARHIKVIKGHNIQSTEHA